MSNSQAYWENRKARELYGELVKVEEAAEELRQVYITAANEIEAEAIKLAKRFQLQNNLTVKDAERLLSKARSPEDIKALIAALKKDPKNAGLVAELESQAYAARINRLSEVQAAIDSMALAILGRAQSTMTPVLAEIGRAMYYREIFAMQQRAGAAFSFARITPQRVLQILNTRWEGANFSERLWANREKLAKEVKEQLLLGVLTGRSQQRMVNEIEHKFSASYNSVRRLVRTEANYVANELGAQSYEDTGVEKYIYVAILDLRTSMICRSLDKKVFKLKDKKVGKNYPPMHPWCRSTTIAWMPAELLKKLQQAAIDPATGETITVPGDMTYDEWYQQYGQDRKIVAGTGVLNYGRLRYYSDEELKELNARAGVIVNKYMPNETRHNGVLHVIPDESTDVAFKDWDCSIYLRHESSMHLAIHENIHAHSASYYGQEMYKQWRPYEEGLVELLAQEISKAEGFEYLPSASYKTWVKNMREINAVSGVYDSDMSFAIAALQVPLDKRKAWLIGLANG